MRLPFRRWTSLTLLGAIFATAACEDDATAPSEEFDEGTVMVDASSPVTSAYVSLADGGSVVTPADPSSSTEWEIALRRFGVRLNGGVAGPGDVAGYGLANNAALTDVQVTALTEADGDAAFAAVTEADIPSASAFEVDGILPDPGASWFRFDGQAGTLVANPSAAWKVQESGDGYAVFRVSELVMAGQVPSSITIEHRHQDMGASLGSISSTTLDLSAGPAYAALSDGSLHDVGTCDWDIGVTPELSIEVNDGCGAGTFPLDAAEDFSALTDAGDAPEYGGFLAALSGAFPATVDDASGVFWYNIEGNNRLWPTFNVFLVRTGSAIYKVQVTSYYDATGQSGFPTIRFQQLQ
ncbi:MAG: hypothetical protein HKO53_15285 [Gemmatimonadetes bacterium]|nr:hypothetical protein [Gemmatimonadota bacterium]